MNDNDVLSGVIRRLTAFFADIPCYIDERKQDINLPCFFVRTISVNQERKLGNRLRRIYSFDIEYHPPDNERSARDISNVRTDLLTMMEYINIGDDGIPTRGINVSTHKEDGVLHFMIDYEVFILVLEDKQPAMKVLTQSPKIKGA